MSFQQGRQNKSPREVPKKGAPSLQPPPPQDLQGVCFDPTYLTMRLVPDPREFTVSRRWWNTVNVNETQIIYEKWKRGHKTPRTATDNLHPLPREQRNKGSLRGVLNKTGRQWGGRSFGGEEPGPRLKTAKWSALPRKKCEKSGRSQVRDNPRHRGFWNKIILSGYYFYGCVN